MFDTITLYTEAEDAMELLISLGIPTITGIVFLILGWTGATELAARIRATARKTRKYIDEPTDPAVMLLERLGEALTKRDVDPELVSRILREVLDHMSQPPQEVNIEGVAK